MDDYRVWAIEYTDERRVKRVVAVSAESEYGAVKRLVGNRCALIHRVEVIPGRVPQWAERRIEGTVDHAFDPATGTWEYT